MAANTNKDQILLERIIADFQAESSNAEDLVNLIHILLKQNDKQALLTEIKDIYEENPNVESFVDWVWDLFAEKDNQGREETKSDYSDVNDKKAHAAPNQSNQTEKSSNDIKTTDESAAPPVIKRSRPAIYDEYERNEKLENLRNVNRMAKNAEKKKPNNNNNNPRQHNNNNNNNNNFPPNPNMNGRRPAPPSGPQREAPREAPKEEPKKSILDRIVKPGDKDKKSITLGKISLDTRLATNNPKQEKIIKKVKPNTEIKTIQRQPGGDHFATKPKYQPAHQQASYDNQAPSGMAEENPDQGEHGADAQKLKVRCRNWPNCKNEACQFHHPVENCKNFPACRFGDKCLYIHPAIHCKFGAYCQRPNCAYVHPKMPAQMQYYGFGGGPGPQKRPIKAHFNAANPAGGAGQGTQGEAQNGGEQNETQ